MPLFEFEKGIKLILHSTFFKFNNTFYRQIFGSPMGSPLSPIIANLVMQDLEREAKNRIDFQFPLFFRYVDDILIGAPEENIHKILDVFNSLHERLNFTLELNDGNRINFLNLNITMEGNEFIFDLYHKPTFSGRYLNFYSKHPISQKRSVIYGLVDKIFLLTNPEFHQKNLENTIKILLNNGYPIHFIFNNINRRIKHLFNNKVNIGKTNNTNILTYCSIPFLNSYSKKLSQILSKFNIKTAFHCNNKLNKLINTGKDDLLPTQHMNSVYRIDCSGCNASYIGQTKRQLKTRIKEHKQDLFKKTGTFSVVSEHRMKYGHDFDWEEVKVLDIENNYYKRIISEMIHIKRHNNNINKQTDTDLFPDTYIPIVQKFPT